jgi:glycosyltransferase involved in cell wall biosynthesis
MRITFVLPTATMGGGNRVVAIYARELARRGHQVSLVSIPPKPEPLRRKLSSWLKGSGWSADQRRLRSHLDDEQLDHKVLQSWRPVTNNDVPEADVVIATWWETAEWVSRFSPDKGAQVYFIQGHEVFPYLPADRCAATYKLPMHKIVVAQWLKDVMRSEYGDEVVDVVPNSVDRSQFDAPSRSKQSVPTVGLIYANSSLKGIDTALAALSIVRESIPDLKVVCFGSDQPQGNLEILGVDEFIFSPPQHEIAGIYSRCDVWLTASRSEGFNLPAMEAMACRTPVVSTRTGWPVEAIQPGLNGLLADIDDVPSLAKAVEWVLTRSSEEWTALSSTAYATVASSSWVASVSLFERALERACDRAKRNEIAGLWTQQLDMA